MLLGSTCRLVSVRGRAETGDPSGSVAVKIGSVNKGSGSLLPDFGNSGVWSGGGTPYSSCTHAGRDSGTLIGREDSEENCPSPLWGKGWAKRGERKGQRQPLAKPHPFSSQHEKNERINQFLSASSVPPGCVGWKCGSH